MENQFKDVDLGYKPILLGDILDRHIRDSDNEDLQELIEVFRQALNKAIEKYKLEGKTL